MQGVLESAKTTQLWWPGKGSGKSQQPNYEGAAVILGGAKKNWARPNLGAQFWWLGIGRGVEKATKPRLVKKPHFGVLERGLERTHAILGAWTGLDKTKKPNQIFWCWKRMELRESRKEIAFSIPGAGV